MVEVFISYSQKERGQVAPIAARLADLGVEAWFDKEISAGESFGAVIRAKLKEAKAVLVCWSPEAIQSQWIDAEADYAREVNTYVPVFIAPSALMPPFNRIHTDDLSSWDGSVNDPTWLKLVDRIAKLLGRDGVAAAARAYAAGDDRTLYEFARRYPDEPAARSVWTNAESRHRKEFEGRLEEARSAAAARTARVSAEASDLDARIEATVATFEAWLSDEQRGTATGPKPDPSLLVKRHIPAEERKLREEVAALSSVLAESRVTEEELNAAKAETTRLSEQLAEKSGEVKILRDQINPLSDAAEKEKIGKKELEAAQAEIGRLVEEVAKLKDKGLRAVQETAQGQSQNAARIFEGTERFLPKPRRLDLLLALLVSLSIFFGVWFIRTTSGSYVVSTVVNSIVEIISVVFMSALCFSQNLATKLTCRWRLNLLILFFSIIGLNLVYSTIDLAFILAGSERYVLFWIMRVAAIPGLILSTILATIVAFVIVRSPHRDGVPRQSCGRA